MGDRAGPTCKGELGLRVVLLLLLLHQEAVVLVLLLPVHDDAAIALVKPQDLLLLRIWGSLPLNQLLWVLRGHYLCEVEGASSLTESVNTVHFLVV